MSRPSSEVVQLAEPNEIIARVFHDWLDQEKISSLTDNNAVLNEWQSYRDSAGKAWDDPSNAYAVKGRSHYDRINNRLSMFAEERHTTDEFFGLQIHEALVSLSGHFRLQCVIRAQSHDQYMGLRYGRESLGIDIAPRVDSRLLQRFGALPTREMLAQSVISYDALVQETADVNDNRRTLLKNISDNVPSRLGGLRESCGISTRTRKCRVSGWISPPIMLCSARSGLTESWQRFLSWSQSHKLTPG